MSVVHNQRRQHGDVGVQCLDVQDEGPVATGRSGRNRYRGGCSWRCADVVEERVKIVAAWRGGGRGGDRGGGRYSRGGAEETINLGLDASAIGMSQNFFC